VGNVHGVYNNSQGILNITGNVSGGPGAGLNTWGAVWINGGSGTVDGNVAATIYGGGVWVQANANNLAVVTITGDVTTTDYRETDGVGAGFAGVKAEGKVRVIIKGSITDGAYGQPAVMGRFFRDAANPPLQWVDIPYWDIPTGTASYERLYHPAYIPGGLAEKDVREGVGYFGVLVGTLAVPDPGSVALGVPTDDTVGTAVLTAAAVESAVWDALRADHTTDGTYGDVDEWAGAIDSQQIRDAMKLAPSAGAPAANSIDDKIDTRAAPGDAMTLTAGERASVATTIWSYLASALTTAGSIGKALVDYITYALTKLGLISASGITTSTLIVGGIPADNTTISIYQGTDHTIAFSVYDENGDPVDLTGEDADIRFEATTPTRIVKDLDDGDITVGPAINQGTLTLTATETRNLPAPRHYEYELRVKTAAIGEQVQARGRLVVIEALITSMAGL